LNGCKKKWPVLQKVSDSYRARFPVERAMSRKRREPEDDGSSKYEWGGGLKGEGEVKEEGGRQPEEGEEKKQKKQPKMNLKVSGLLREEALKDEAGQVVDYVASEDSAMPDKEWRLYVFKGEESLDPIPLHRKEWYLFGKDRGVADVPTDHLSCSRQHAVIQFRKRRTRNEYGDELVAIKPYIMDLKSSNGTFLNKEKIDSLRYYELRHQDLVTFAASTREYVLLCTQMAGK
jgi:smad nuclear-interacting protein 1